MVTVNDSDWDGEHVPTCFIDFLGQEVRVGDYVVYATSQSSSAKLTLGKVLEFKIKDSNDEFYGHQSWSYGSGRREPEKFTYTWRLKVQPLKDSGYSYRYNKTGVGPRAVTLGNIYNVLKVDASRAEFEEYDGS